MKKFLLYFVLMIGSFTVAIAQDQPDVSDPGKKEQKIQALYVAYITKELNLSESEAQKFWPVHSQFESEMKALNDKEDMTELAREEASLNIKKKYQDRFTKILGNNRTDNFYRKDGEFRKKLVERLRKIRQQNNINQRPIRRRP